MLDAIVTVWVITWRMAWPAVLIGMFLLALSAIRPLRAALPPPHAFTAILLSPLPMIVWGGVNWTRQTTRDGGWRALLLDGLALLVVVASIWIVVRFRRVRGRWLLALAGVCSLVFAAAAWLVGTMSITGRWW